MGTGLMGTPDGKKQQRTTKDYIERIPIELLDAILDQMDAKANGLLEVSFAMGGVAKIYATQKKTYK